MSLANFACRTDGADAANAYCYTSLISITETLERHNGEQLPPRNDTVVTILIVLLVNTLIVVLERGTEVNLQIFDVTVLTQLHADY